MGETLLWVRLAFAAALYSFVSLLFYMLWRSLELGEKRPQNDFAPARLVLLSNPERPKQVYSLRPITAVGRAADNDIVLNDPFASAHHALILWRDGRWWIEDLGSQNGTWLNDELVPRLAALAFGDLIRIGQTELFFEADDHAATHESPTQELMPRL